MKVLKWASMSFNSDALLLRETNYLPTIVVCRLTGLLSRYWDLDLVVGCHVGTGLAIPFSIWAGCSIRYSLLLFLTRLKVERSNKTGGMDCPSEVTSP